MEFNELSCIELFKIFYNSKNQHNNIHFSDENSLFEKYYQFRKHLKDFISSKKDKPALDFDIGKGRNIV